MEWALDAQQSGYKFLPEQNSYKNQIAIIKKWVGMDHMCPNVVSVNLPGERIGDYIHVTSLNFIHQFHSMLSDPLFNVLENFMVNTTDLFSQYTPQMAGSTNVSAVRGTRVPGPTWNVHNSSTAPS
jgi:hypothetical protein